MTKLAAYIGDSRKVALVDNASFHKTALTLGVLHHVGFEALFTAPYTPESNSIELVFGLIKRNTLKQAILDQKT